MKVWIKEDPNDVADFTLDWTSELAGDLITASEWLEIEAGITTDSRPDTFTSTSTTIWVGGGTMGQTYSLTNRITTAGGRIFDQTVELRVPIPETVPGYDGCLWPVDPACLTDLWNSYDDATRTRALALASSTLYRLTGYRVGGCPVKVRPRPSRGFCALPYPYLGAMPYWPVNLNGNWYNAPCSPCSDPRLVELPPPVTSISEVKVDGAVVSAANYRIVDGHYLAWVGAGDPPWPGEQDYVIPDTQPGTFSVTYMNSHAVDALGAYAAGLLTMEFAKACASSGTKCRLPTTVVSIVRQGVSYDLSTGAFPDGKTGIREIDAYIEMWNPKGRRPGQVIVPGKRIAVSER
jgi:hypothetical protein